MTSSILSDINIEYVSDSYVSLNIRQGIINDPGAQEDTTLPLTSVIILCSFGGVAILILVFLYFAKSKSLKRKLDRFNQLPSQVDVVGGYMSAITAQNRPFNKGEKRETMFWVDHSELSQEDLINLQNKSNVSLNNINNINNNNDQFSSPNNNYNNENTSMTLDGRISYNPTNISSNLEPTNRLRDELSRKYNSIITESNQRYSVSSNKRVSTNPKVHTIGNSYNDEEEIAPNEISLKGLELEGKHLSLNRISNTFTTTKYSEAALAGDKIYEIPNLSEVQESSPTFSITQTPLKLNFN